MHAVSAKEAQAVAEVLHMAGPMLSKQGAAVLGGIIKKHLRSSKRHY
jgi:hypothetical protein